MSSAPPDRSPCPTVAELFLGFLSLGLMGFGGALPLARRMVVEKRRWITSTEFTELLALCQVLPGGNIGNMSIALGMRFRGVPGAVAALLGLIAVPGLVVVSLGTLYDRYRQVPIVQHGFAGLSAAAAGLLVATAIKIARPLWRKWIEAAIAVVCVIAMVFLGLPLLWVMLVLGAAGIYFAPGKTP